jgi:hypothetical protein
MDTRSAEAVVPELPGGPPPGPGAGVRSLGYNLRPPIAALKSLLSVSAKLSDPDLLALLQTLSRFLINIYIYILYILTVYVCMYSYDTICNSLASVIHEACMPMMILSTS